MHIFIDIETIPSQLGWVRDDLAAKIKPPGVLKKAESIAEWERESKPGAVEEAWLKTSFDGGLGQIVAIGAAVNDGTVQTANVTDFSDSSEKDLLSEFWSLMRTQASTNHGTRPVVVGHNHVGFDLPFLWKRSIVHGIKPPIWWPRNPKPWSDHVFDTMLQWAGDRERISMDMLCRVLGIPGKADGPTGADVWPMAQAGRFEEIAAYCGQDVERTRAIFNRLTFGEHQ